MADERVAIVTGATGGLGRACFHRFIADGMRVVAVARNIDHVAALVDSVGPSALAAPADIRTRAACRAVAAATVAAFGRIDVVVNAAGVFPRRPVLDIDADDWHHVLDVNVLGTYFMMIETIPHLRASGAGRIVNVTSIDGFKAHPANAHYAASKAAVISLTRSLALEVAPDGILVNSVAPGPMASEAAKATDWYAPMVAALPTQRPIEPDEIANLVAFLASPANVSIAGENIVVSGAGAIV